MHLNFQFLALAKLPSTVMISSLVLDTSASFFYNKIKNLLGENIFD